MKILAILALCAVKIFALSIVNGEAIVLKFNKNTSEISANGKKIPLVNSLGSDEKIAIIAANYRAKNDIKLKITQDGKTTTEIINLIKGDYKSEAFSVAPSKVKPPKEAKARIERELAEANKIYAKTTPKILLQKPFLLPSNAKITSAFGNARTFNGELKSYHSGTDYRAAMGTDVHSVGEGVVVIAKDRYYAGGSVVIDHGAGVYSQYYHLSKILVKVGDKIGGGDKLGLSGASGRVSGPHLHFGIAINGVSVNPLDFINKFNKVVFENE